MKSGQFKAVKQQLQEANIGRNVNMGSYYRKLSGLTDIIEINIEIKIV